MPFATALQRLFPSPLVGGGLSTVGGTLEVLNTIIAGNCASRAGGVWLGPNAVFNNGSVIEDNTPNDVAGPGA